MALDKTTLGTAIQQAYDKASTGDDPQAARKQMARDIADAIDLYIRAGVVNVTVATTGTAVAQTGTGTGVIT